MTLEPNDTTRVEGTLLVVPTERHVERLARDGVVCETRASLRQRLLDALASDVSFASPEVARMALSDALAVLAPDDPLLAPLLRGGEGTWLRTVDAVDAALAALRASAIGPAALARLEGRGRVGARALAGTALLRARTLRGAMVALDAALSAKGLTDARAAGSVLAAAIEAAPPEHVARAARHARLLARHLVHWDAAELRWWGALDAALRARGGEAILELPTVPAKIDAARERSPLETLFDDVARVLGDAPEVAPIPPLLGDLGFTGPVPFPERITLRQVADAEAQGRAVAEAVTRALAPRPGGERGAFVEEVAVLVPRFDEAVVEPIRRALADVGLEVHVPYGAPPSASSVCKTALTAHALASRGLPRKEVAELLRSRYLDARAVTGVDDVGAARRLIFRLATALEQTPTSRSGAKGDPVSELEATARAARLSDDALILAARAVGAILWTVEGARTRLEHVRVTRALFDALGLPTRIGHDARAVLARDEVPTGLARAELHALAEDARSWRILMGALDLYADAARALGAGDAAVTGEAFRHELLRMVDASLGPSGARRVLAVRLARAAELAAEPLAALVVVDANEGVLPAARARQGLLSEGLARALRETEERGAVLSPSSLAARDLAGLALAVGEAASVTFVHRTHDAEGALLAPSPVVLWLERGGVATEARSSSPVRASALTEREARLRALSHDPASRARLGGDAARRAAVELARESFHGASAEAVAGPAAAWTSQVTVGPELARVLREETGGASRALPVTAVERFARCAFQGYAAQVLGAREEQERDDTPDAREQGTLVHEALAAAFTATRSMWAQRPRDVEGIRLRALEAVDRCLAKDASKSALRRIALEQTREDARRVLEWSLADEVWDFDRAEKSFGDPRDEGEEAWPALALGAGEDVVRVRGTIDRVDRAHLAAEIRVVDYKRSARTAKESQRDVTKSAFQVPLYALVARRMAGARAATGLYLPTSMLDPSYAGGGGAASAAWDEAMGDGPTGVVARTQGVVHAVRGGAIAPAPPDDRVCDLCDYDGACRRPRFVVSEEEEGAGGEGAEPA